MNPPEQLRLWAADIRAAAAASSDPDAMKACLQLSAKYDKLARETEKCIQAMLDTHVTVPWNEGKSRD